MDHYFNSTSDEEQIIQKTQSHLDQSKPEWKESVHLSFDQEQISQSAALELKPKEKKNQSMSIYAKPSLSDQSISITVSGPGALVTEMISEDEIESISLSDEPALTIDVSSYTIAHTIITCLFLE